MPARPGLTLSPLNAARAAAPALSRCPDAHSGEVLFLTYCKTARDLVDAKSPPLVQPNVKSGGEVTPTDVGGLRGRRGWPIAMPQFYPRRSERGWAGCRKSIECARCRALRAALYGSGKCNRGPSERCLLAPPPRRHRAGLCPPPSACALRPVWPRMLAHILYRTVLSRL